MNKKKRDPSSCPVCGMTISPGDLESHFVHELERLYKLSGTGIAAGKKRRPEPGRPPALPGDSGPEGRWETFQRIKTNRQGRLRIKIRKRKADDNCPICIGRFHRTPEELNAHVEQCRNKVHYIPTYLYYCTFFKQILLAICFPFCFQDCCKR